MESTTLDHLASICGATVEGDGTRTVTGPASLSEAGPEEVSFLAHGKYRGQLANTRAAGVVVGPDVTADGVTATLLRCEDPNRAFSALVSHFAGAPARPEPGVHPSAVIADSARIGEGVSVGALVSVGAQAELGDGAVLHPGCVVGERAVVGPETVLHPGVVLYEGTRLGARCVLHAGVVLGADGFGFEPTATGWEKVPQCGDVRVGDDVEIGANTTVDRARFGTTAIGNGVKIDDQVMIGHNCTIGDGAMVIAQSGLAGTTHVGKRAILAARSGVGGHASVGDGAILGPGTTTHRNVPAGARLMMPALSFEREVGMRIPGALDRLPDLLRRVRELEGRLARLEGGGA
jgi:UDP-3-O-[3-hydroxymyristoyl] glucosamine N-acyltransferase